MKMNPEILKMYDELEKNRADDMLLNSIFTYAETNKLSDLEKMIFMAKTLHNKLTRLGMDFKCYLKTRRILT